MSKDDSAAAQAAMASWPERVPMPPDWDISDACRRLLDAMGDLACANAGWRDVAALVRQVLITARATYGGNRALAVPATDPWPTAEQWNELHCSPVQLADGRLSIRAGDWEPPPSLEDDEIGADLAREQVLAVYRDVKPAEPDLVPADPFWKTAHGYPTYRGETQRQAARAAVLNDGGSLLVALPTGRGKTAVAWSKVLLAAQGVTIVVVPTVVLALDMERRTDEASRSRGRPLSPLGRYAYVGGLDPDAKRQLRDAVRTGSQRLLYTSPEAFVSGLASAVLECAQAGLLQQVVIDEAHLVDQWGTDFRPEFQTMPGLIREAYEKAPADKKPSVLLLSATLAQHPVDLLTRLFAVGSDQVDVVWGSEIRTEPAFFLASHTEESARRDAVLEAVSRLPRPLILYATKVDDAENWAGFLRQAGLSRVGCVTGNSSEHERRTVMERWRGITPAGDTTATSLDVIVGTSAFGLGLDMPNVRTVVHACLPETIDRYYQEVGRAGRDGRPSIAYLCSGPQDRRIAESLSEPSMIGDDRGWKRWRALLNAGIPLTPLRYRVRKSTLPVYMDEGYGRSAQWNVRTLTLMAQAEIIELRVPQLVLQPGLSAEAEERARESFYADVEDFLEFELANGKLQGQHGWTKALGEVRQTVRDARRQALTSLLTLAEGRECVGRIIARHYRVTHDGGSLITSPACRGCPACRRDPATSPGTHPPEPSPLLPRPRPGRDPLAAWRGDNPSLFVWYEEGDNIHPLLVRFAQRNVRVFAGLGTAAADKLQRAAVHAPIVLDDPDSVLPLAETYEGPVAFVLPDARVGPEISARVRLRLVSYIVGPKMTPDPERPGWPLRDAPWAISAGALLRGM